LALRGSLWDRVGPQIGFSWFQIGLVRGWYFWTGLGLRLVICGCRLVLFASNSAQIGHCLVSDRLCVASDWLCLVSGWFVLLRIRFRLVLGGACAPKGQSEPASNHKTQSETNNNQYETQPGPKKTPVKPTLCLTRHGDCLRHRLRSLEPGFPR
jgi:hypothetical protein